MGYAAMMTKILAAALCWALSIAAAFAQAPPPTSGRGVAVTTAPNTWTAQNNQPPCPLTFATTIAVSAVSCAAGAQYSVGVQYVMLTGPSATLAFPAGLKDGQVIEIRLAQDATGNRVVTPASGYLWPGGTFRQTTTPNAIDKFVCEGFGGSSPTFVSITCEPVGAGLAPVVFKGFVQAKAGPNSTTSSASVTLTNPVGTGHSLLCMVLQGNHANQITTIGDGIGGVTYSQIDAAGPNGGFFTVTFDAITITNGAQTITVNFSAAQAFSQVTCGEYSGISAIDGHVITYITNPGTGTDAVKSATITTTNNGNIIWGGIMSNCAGSFTVGSGFTLRLVSPSPNSGITEDLTQATAGSIAATATDTAGASCVYSVATVGLH
jgi:hypothetical protein